MLNVSAEEMEAVQLQPWEKNYCADLHIKVNDLAETWLTVTETFPQLQAKICHWENGPFGWRCNHIRHETEHCLQEDYKLRMMEYERERRLRQRAKRIGAAGGGDDEE